MSVYLLHGHHDACISEYETREEAVKRIEDIRGGLKPSNETPTRLRLMRILTDEEAAGWIAACAARSAAESVTWSAWSAAQSSFKEAEILWHRSVCVADCPWDGETIFPEKKGT